jgi:hypothetical protein
MRAVGPQLKIKNLSKTFSTHWPKILLLNKSQHASALPHYCPLMKFLRKAADSTSLS